MPTPRARALPAGNARPFLSAANAAQPVDLAARGYTEAEFGISGVARLYDWNAQGVAQPRTDRTPFATRLLLRRPADGRRFSGIVFVEALNPSLLYDTAPVWALAQDELLRAGHAWVGVTIKPVAIAALKRFDATRYESLGFAANPPADCRAAPGLPGAPGSDAELAPLGAENGLAFDVLAQTGALLRSGSRENPLGDLQARRLVAAGYGQSGSLLLTFVNALHASQRLGDGAAVFDAYLQVGGGLQAVPLTQCAPALPDDDARRGVARRDSPFLSLLTESEVPRVPAALRRQDSDDPEDFFRLFEIAGAAHLPLPAGGRPGPRELQQLQMTANDDADPCEETASSGPSPLPFAVRATVLQLQQLLLDGTAPPRAPLLSLDGEGRLARDALGVATGGLRLPAVSVPATVTSGRSTPRRPDDARAVWRCSLTGTSRALEADELRRLHGSRADYLKRQAEAIDQAVAARFLTPSDGAALKANAARSAPSF